MTKYGIIFLAIKDNSKLFTPCKHLVKKLKKTLAFYSRMDYIESVSGIYRHK